jgi:hypothetical protein
MSETLIRRVIVDPKAPVIEATNLRVIQQTTNCVAFVDLRISPFGLLLRDCKIITTPRGLRIAFATRHLFMPDLSDWISFSAAAIEAVEAAYPDAVLTPPPN